MADNSRSISGSIEVESSGEAQIALELARWIANKESSATRTVDREYLIRLYVLCREATANHLSIDGAADAVAKSLAATK